MPQNAIQWVGSSREDLSAFPKEAKGEAGHQLFLVEKGRDPDDWKPLSIVGPGAREIRICADQQFRVVYVANLGDCIYVLHAFEKKTQKTPKKDLDLAKRRYREVKALVRAQKKTAGGGGV